MIRRVCSLLFALCVVPAGAMAADSSGAFAVKGVGLTKCSQYVTAIQEQDQQQAALYVGWLGGFITASNQNQEETFDLTPWQNVRTLAAALVNYCDKNADMRFAEASARLAASLRKDRIVERSELVPIEHEGKTHFVYSEALRRAQASLSERGLYTGDVNGEFNDALRTALETFQEENKLPVNGLPDQRTLFVLFRSGSE